MNLKRIILALAVFLLVTSGGATAYLYLSLNSLVKKVIVSAGSAITGTNVTVDSVQISPFSGKGSLNGVALGNPKGYSEPYSMKLGSITVSLEKQSLWKKQTFLNSIEIRNPRIFLIGTTDGTNLQQIIRNIKSSTASKGKSGKTSSLASASGKSCGEKTFVVRSVEISGTKLDVALSAFGQSVRQSLDIPEIRLRNLGSDGSGLTQDQLFQEILKPLINDSINEGIKAASKQGLLQLQQNGGREIGNFLNGLIR